jgi:hypothetical protein
MPLRSPGCLYALLLAFFLLLIPEDEGDEFLQNVYQILPDYTALYPRRQSFPLMFSCFFF